MGLTAREWILLSKKEQEERSKELSQHECFLLRTSLANICFTEEEKANMTEEAKIYFPCSNKKELTSEQVKLFKMTITEQINYLFGKERG